MLQNQWQKGKFKVKPRAAVPLNKLVKAFKILIKNGLDFIFFSIKAI